MRRRSINFWILLASPHHPSSMKPQSWHCLKKPPTTSTISFTRQITRQITKIPKLTCLKSWWSFSEHVHQLLRSTPVDTSRNQWLNQAWTEEWKAVDPSRLHWFVDEPGELLDEDLPRKQWTTLLVDLKMQWEIGDWKTLLRMIAATPDKL